ncbi:hypothetical protein [Nocardia altamirensis]|uniref:hypothetical protein n=1 Tax=Nocardia altamirensis TaxID=472158 RepID=UPI00114CF59E|nr:hypothetical protein [Nocardia altamirensis]
MAERADVRKRRAKALAMRERGSGVDEIREALGYSTNRLVRHDIRKARQDIAHPKPAQRTRKPREDDGLPVDILTSRDRRVHRFIAQRTKERERRLEGLLRASGLTVAQMSPERLGKRVWHLEQYDALNFRAAQRM